MRHYRDGLALAPDDPVLGNNLASVLGQLGCMVEARAALAAAQRGLATDSAWRSALEQTAKELAGQAPARSPACDAAR